MDPARYELLEHAIDQIRLHPVAGGGFDASSLEMSSDGKSEHGIVRFKQVVHNAYLQVWADMGFVGLMGFCCIIFSWVTVLPRCIIRIRKCADADRRAYYYNAIFLLMCVSMFFIFHPISTECSDWIRFGSSSAVLAELTKAARSMHVATPQRLAA
jgi:O-antigen ligase